MLLKVETRLRCRDQTRAKGVEESDDHVLLGDIIRFVENSDKSIPQIAELMGVSDVALSQPTYRYGHKPAPIAIRREPEALPEFCRFSRSFRETTREQR